MIDSARAIIPMKSFDEAKSRLSAVVPPAFRQRLSRAMYLDLLDKLSGACLDGFSVTTRDPEVAQLCLAVGGEAIRETELGSMNSAIAAAIAECRDRSKALLIVPADLPYLRQDTLTRAAAIALSGAVCLVQARRDGGTNLLAFPSSAPVRPLFGPNSFRRHLDTVQAAGMRTVMLTAPDAAFDLDTVEDLVALRRVPPRGRVGVVLARMLVEGDDVPLQRDFA